MCGLGVREFWVDTMGQGKVLKKGMLGQTWYLKKNCAIGYKAVFQ